MVIKKNSINSNFWLQRHFSDSYVKQAQKRNIRSRAWFKLDEIQRKDRVFYPGMTIVELGSAPGGWSEYAITKIGKNGRIIACDTLPMNSITGVDFLQGDFREPLILKKLFDRINKQKIQLVLSDMAPNMSGIPIIDIPRSMYLVEIALNVCCNILVPGGNFLVKVFQGEGFNEYLGKIRCLFNKVRIRKPAASRANSREVYIVAIGHHKI